MIADSLEKKVIRTITIVFISSISFLLFWKLVINMAKNNSKEPFSMNTLGSKRQVIATLCNVVNYAMSCSNIVGVQELFAGGFCFSSHFESEYELKFRTANEIDYGVVSFFRCLQDPYKTDLLIEQIQLLADEYRTKFMFEKAKEERIKPETSQLRAAALTYIVVEYSLRADRQNFSQHHADKGIPHKSLSKLFDVDKTIGDVQIFCGDYKEQFNKYKDRSDILIYLDPPYISTKVTPKRRGEGKINQKQQKHQVMCIHLQ